ncbi:tetrathionate reductase family octaheme c-type cytochrome [candidate division KSB1 bacterium]|nr:MAG: tetrathionate reductase family octaheme c-type cytochrome [candidate division KSB1 bacterium]
MKRIFLVAVIFGVILSLTLAVLPKQNRDNPVLNQLRSRYQKKEGPKTDHTRFAVLQKSFNKPQDVTEACISCHTERHKEVMQSSHWNWDRTEYIEGKGIRKVGKRNILNNFCIGISGNETTCNSCHIGYGYDRPDFDFKNPYNVDCLACHDNSNTYVKADAGLPDTSVNLAVVAQHVGRPQRTNCGACHFFGGGGNNVKHGDLEQALFDPSRNVDVHMGSDGVDMSCVDCHTASKHQMLGKLYSVSSMNRNRVECETCHTALPHADNMLNNHTMKVACQTCHIPTYAKVNPTKTYWDWSTAGALKNGEPYEVKDSSGADVYLSTKGSFVWGKNLEPEYVWFNGTASHYLVGDTFDPSVPLKINELHGSYDDPDSKVIPVKIQRTKQIYDEHHRYLIQPKTVSTEPGDGGFWAEFNWQRAIEEGMKRLDLPYSGQFGFTETEMYWPVNHMVSPAAQTTECSECHTRRDSRLAGLRDFYMPGRDYSSAVETLGATAILLTLAGVTVHGGGRWWMRRKRKEVR